MTDLHRRKLRHARRVINARHVDIVNAGIEQPVPEQHTIGEFGQVDHQQMRLLLTADIGIGVPPVRPCIKGLQHLEVSPDGTRAAHESNFRRRFGVGHIHNAGTIEDGWQAHTRVRC